MNYRGTVEVTSLLDALTDPEMIEEITRHLKLQLGGMKIACYYGCGQVRPQEITNAPNTENPLSMEQLLNAAGAECVDWNFKTECVRSIQPRYSPQGSTKRYRTNFP